MSNQDSNRFIPQHGNFKRLISYQKAEVIYDITFRFCDRFLNIGDRTIDQMKQAARSGKQNIGEGSEASGTSKEPAMRLLTDGRFAAILSRLFPCLPKSNPLLYST